MSNRRNRPSGGDFDAIDVEAELSRAFAELDSKIPDGYFETFSSKVAASLEAEASMQSPTSNVPTPPTNTPPPSAERDEHSGLHEIKALAQNARQRISRRQRSESDVEEAILSSSSAALSAVVLPDPSVDAIPVEPLAVAEPMSSSSAFAPAPIGSPGAPTWLWALGGTALIAAAAAAALFYFSRGGSDKADGQQVAAADSAETSASEPPAPPPPAEPTVAALPEQAPSAAEPEPDSDNDDADTAATGEAIELAADEPADEGADEGIVAAKAPRALGGAKADTKRARDSKDKERDSKPARKEVARPDPDEAKEHAKKSSGEGGEAKGDINDLLDQVAGTETRQKEEKTAEKKVDKKRLDSGDIRSAMGSVSGAVNACQKQTGFIGRVSVKFSVSPSGKVGGVKASGGNAAVHSCVASAVKRARFPTFNPPSMSFRYSFLLSD